MCVLVVFMKKMSYLCVMKNDFNEYMDLNVRIGEVCILVVGILKEEYNIDIDDDVNAFNILWTIVENTEFSTLSEIVNYMVEYISK